MTTTTIQVGDTGNRNGSAVRWRVVAVLPNLLLLETANNSSGIRGTCHCAPADFIPDPKPVPKAVPGQWYRRVDGDKAVGLSHGRLWNGYSFDFDPAKWTPIEEPQP